MNIKVVKVKQYNSTYKHILMLDGIPVCITESESRMSECIQFVNGYDADINDGAIKKSLTKWRQTHLENLSLMGSSP